MSRKFETRCAVEFTTKVFDCGETQGLCVNVKGGGEIDLRRQAIRIGIIDTPADVARRLHGLADWLERQEVGP
jgi:hypothetical protein